MYRTCRVVTLGLVLVYGHYRLSVTYGLEFCSLENKVLGVKKFLLKWRKMKTGSRKKVLFQNFWRSKKLFYQKFSSFFRSRSFNFFRREKSSGKTKSGTRNRLTARKPNCYMPHCAVLSPECSRQASMIDLFLENQTTSNQDTTRTPATTMIDLFFLIQKRKQRERENVCFSGSGFCSIGFRL